MKHKSRPQDYVINHILLYDFFSTSGHIFFTKIAKNNNKTSDMTRNLNTVNTNGCRSSSNFWRNTMETLPKTNEPHSPLLFDVHRMPY